jgi:hypothetical protein
MRIQESLAAFGIVATFKPKGLYDLLLLSLESAVRRANRRSCNAR